MIQQTSESSDAILICPECKNAVNLSRYPNVAPGMVVECDHCGMTLLVKSVADGKVESEIVDEGK